MSGRRSRFLGFALLASAGAGLMALTSMINSAFAFGATPDVTDPVPPTTEVMGGSGAPIPPPGYVDAVNNLYIQPNLPGTAPAALFTPEGFYPLTGVKDLPLNTSVTQGVQILNDTIQPYIIAGTPVGVFGYSQSAIIASLEMANLQAAGVPSSATDFVLIGDPMSPNGGLFERFDGLMIPSLGLTFYGATPADAYPANIYSLEYDPASDYPRYPINLLADLNAEAGYSYLHGTYPSLTPAEVATAIPLTTSGPTLTDYYMIPVTNLPLLEPLRSIPIIGNPIADLLQPDLTYLVNLGYGDPLYGYSTDPANVPTPFGLFPPLSGFEQLPGLLASGTQQGIENFSGDLTGAGPHPVSLSLLDAPSGMASTIMTDPLAALPAATNDPASSLTNLADTLSNVLSADYAALLPTADLGLAALTALPAYDASLFLDGIEAGDLLNAIGDPIAADVGLVSLASLMEAEVVLSAVDTTVGALTGLIP